MVFEYLSKWFKANRLSLNFDKTHFLQFTTKNDPQIDLDIRSFILLSVLRQVHSLFQSVLEGSSYARCELVFLLFIVCSICLSFLTLCNTSSFLT
jgi:hypothetical protein